MKEERQDSSFDYPELDKMSAAEFYDTFKNFMFSIGLKEGDYYLAETAIDDVMATIFMKNKCHYDPKAGKFRNYLATMVRNACRSLKRKERRYVHYEESDMVLICEENGAVSRDTTHDMDDVRRWISEGIKKLRKKVRSQDMVDAFVKAYLDEERPKDVARALNVRADDISLAKHRYMSRLRAIIEEIMEEDD
ncbi:MAG: sigma-70 family RNA polymerase sigma factor [Victivallales bacterium]|nr:sigma-70 family RNA polymerase sigma factor [Victivallales bacterium]